MRTANDPAPHPAAKPKPKRNPPRVGISPFKGISIIPLGPNRYRVRADAIDGQLAHDRRYTATEKQVLAIAAELDEKREPVERAAKRARMKAAAYPEETKPRDEPKYTIKSICDEYEAWCISTKKAGRTVYNYDRYLIQFRHWCDTQDIHTTDQLTKKVLGNYFAWANSLTHQLYKARKGTQFSQSTRNRMFTPVKTALRHAIRADKCPHLRDDMLNDAMPFVQCDAEDIKARLGGRIARVLDVDELQCLLDAALAFDARDRALDPPARRLTRVRQVAPDIAMLLLNLLRKQEYCFTLVRDAFEDDSVKALIRVQPEVAKRKRYREIKADSFTHIGVDILVEMTRVKGLKNDERPRGEWLSHYAYNQIQGVLDTLAKDYGAPRMTPQDLRATGASYQTALPVSSHDRHERAGHSPATAERSYIPKRRPRGMKSPADTIEEAMRCEDHFARILAAMRAAPPCEPRTEPRRRATVVGRPALLESEAAIQAQLQRRGLVKPPNTKV